MKKIENLAEMIADFAKENKIGKNKLEEFAKMIIKKGTPENNGRPLGEKNKALRDGLIAFAVNSGGQFIARDAAAHFGVKDQEVVLAIKWHNKEKEVFKNIGTKEIEGAKGRRPVLWSVDF